MKLNRSAAIAALFVNALGMVALLPACASNTESGPAPIDLVTGAKPASIDPSLASSVDAGTDAATGAAVPAWQVGSGHPMPVLHKLYTEHLGEWLRDEPTHSFNFGLLGSDVGVSLRKSGQQVFLFGDSLAENSGLNNTKTAATIPLGPPPDVLDLPKLVFPLDSSGTFVPVNLPGLSFGPLTVPWGGVGLGDSTYVYYAAAWDPTLQTQTQSALAHATGDDFTSMQLDYVVPSTHFIGVQAIEAGDDLLLFGEGPYRQSALYFATVSKQQIADHSAWRYYAGQGDAGCPTFSQSEADAVPIIASDCIGEFSVMQSLLLGGYVVTYNCFDTNERGIFMQTSPTPLGPWSAPVKILDPQLDSYTKFIHADPDVIGFDDGLSDWGRETTFGFEYAPNLVHEWTRELSPGVFSLVYTLSSWNPYTTHLVHTVVGVDGTSASPTQRGVGLPKAALVNGDFGTGDLTGWTASGDPFVVEPGSNGTHFVTTFGAKGVAGVGQISQDFVVDSTTSELIFAVTGGDAVVELLHDGDLVRSTHARDSNTTVVTAAWNIAEFQGQKVTLLILDNVTDPWGFINVSGFTLQ